MARLLPCRSLADSIPLRGREEDGVNWLRVKLFTEQTVVCVKCGSVCSDGAGNGSGPLCDHCAAQAKESPYVWIGRALVRRSEVG